LLHLNFLGSKIRLGLRKHLRFDVELLKLSLQ